jgi:tetrahydromethanopterin S-methyltransferase subunit A
MRQAPDIVESLPPRAAPALHEIAPGMELKKCRRCGCMNDALNQAVRAFESSDESEIRALLTRISDYQARMEPLAYDCIGCKKCWGADAIIELAKHFDEVELDLCASGDEGASGDSKSSAASSNRCTGASPIASWPPHAGDYLLGHPDGSVAICTLSNRDLPARLTAEPTVAIAGRCDTENIGVEKVVLNLVANPRIRWLVVCGKEGKGHRAGDAILRLKERGVGADMRVLESASWRPILKNLTLLEVARFREQIEVINLVGVADPGSILAAVRDCANKPLPAFHTASARSTRCGDMLAAVEHIRAKAPKGLRLDRAGFFIVLPQPQKGLIVCEHYENSGRLAHVIEGRQAALIAATAVERGLVAQLDHAAYLGRELAKAEAALSLGIAYEQDAALGKLDTSEKWPNRTKRKSSNAARPRPGSRNETLLKPEQVEI